MFSCRSSVHRIVLVIHGFRRSIVGFVIFSATFDLFRNPLYEPSFIDYGKVESLRVREPEVVHEQEDRLKKDLFSVLVRKRKRMNDRHSRRIVTPWERRSRFRRER